MEIPCVEPGDGETVAVACERAEQKFNKIVLIDGRAGVVHVKRQLLRNDWGLTRIWKKNAMQQRSIGTKAPEIKKFHCSSWEKHIFRSRKHKSTSGDDAINCE